MTIYEKSLFLKIWLKDAFCAPQREADIVAKLFSFTGEFASCCHNSYFHLIVNNLYDFTLVSRISQGVSTWYNALEMDITYIITILGTILVSMTLHEAMHGYVANWLGDDTAKMHGRLTLNPIKHIDPFLTILLPMSIAVLNVITGVYTPIFGGAKPVQFNPARVRYGEWGSALVALAGPMTNLALAFVAFGVLVVSDTTAASDLVAFKLSSDAPLVSGIMVQFILVNLGFFAFNMIPIPPLDGSRVIYALAPDFVRRGMEAIEQFGIIFVFIIVMAASSLISMIMTTVMGAVLWLFSSMFRL